MYRHRDASLVIYDEYLDETEYQSYPKQKSKRLNVVTGAYL